MALFAVTLELTGHTTIEVEAVSVLDARQTAQEQYSTPDDIEEVMPISVHQNNTEVWSI